MVHPVTKEFCLAIAGVLIVILVCTGPGMAAVSPCEPVITVDPGGSVSGAIGSVCDGGSIILNPGVHNAHGIWSSGRSFTIRANTSYGGNRGNTIVDAQDLDMFVHMSSGSLTLDNLTLMNGRESIDGGLVYSGGGGVTLSTVAIANCSAYLSGGAIYSGGPVTISDSVFTNCSAQSGGAIFSTGGTTTTITRSRFVNCSARASGGAVFTNYGGSTATVSGSSFSGCTATGSGGAIFTDIADVTTSDFSGCRAYYGAGISSASRYTVTSSSFTDCIAGNAGGAVFGSSTGPNTIHFCRIYQCGYNAVFDLSRGSARYNWFGTNSGPGYSGVIFAEENPWLVLGAAAAPGTITRSQTASVGANLTFDSAGGWHDPASGHVPGRIPVGFSVTQGNGSVLPAEGLIDAGANQTLFMPEYAGISWVNATVDDESVGVPIQVNGAGFTGTPVTGTVPLKVVFTDASAGLPGMWNWSFGDGAWFNTTDPAETTPNHTYTRPGTYTVSLTVDLAGTPDTLTRTGYVTVSLPVTAVTPVPLPTYSQQDTGETLGDFPSSPGNPPLTVTVNIGGDSKAWRAVVTGTKIQELIVTGTLQHGAGDNVTAPPGTVFQYISLVPARYETITNTVIHFTVPQSWLDENHIDPKSIVLYHLTANGWEALPTTVVSTKDGTVYLSAVSPGFSLFAIAGTPSVPAAATAAATPEIVSTPVTEQVTTPPVTTLAPVTTQTTVPPAPAQVPPKSSAFTLVPVLAVICCIGIIGGGWYARRWWIRRQNPALFAEED